MKMLELIDLILTVIMLIAGIVTLYCLRRIRQQPKPVRFIWRALVLIAVTVLLALTSAWIFFGRHPDWLNQLCVTIVSVILGAQYFLQYKSEQASGK